MAESYLVKKLYERQSVLKGRRLRSQAIILDVANLLSADERLLANRGVSFEVDERSLRGTITYGADDFDERISLKMTDWETLELDGEDVADDLDSAQVYQIFCDKLVMKISVKQITKE